MDLSTGTGEIYLDSAATGKPSMRALMKAIEVCYYTWGSPYRGLYERSVNATAQYEEARERVRAFINAEDANEVVFTSGATDGLNKLIRVLAEGFAQSDRVLLGIAEHNSVLLPWITAQERHGFQIDYLPVNRDGFYTAEEVRKRLTKDTKIVCVAHAGNVLGTVNDIRGLAEAAHENGTLLLADCSQSAPHGLMDVREMQCDFAVFSGHKMYCPFGIGVLYGRKVYLKTLGRRHPVVGGETADRVRKAGVIWADLPHSWEAGTVHLLGAVTLAEAADEIRKEQDERERQEAYLIQRMHRGLASIPHVRLLGPEDPYMRGTLCTFTIQGVHPHDAGDLYARESICVRTGYHCAEMLHEELGIGPTVRASVYYGNTEKEIDRFLDVTEGIRKALSR